MKKFSDYLNGSMVMEGKMSIYDNNPLVSLIMDAAVKSRLYNSNIDTYEVESLKEDKPIVDGSFLTSHLGGYKIQQSFSFRISFFAKGGVVAIATGIMNLVVGIKGSNLEIKKSLSATWNDTAAQTKNNIAIQK